MSSKVRIQTYMKRNRLSELFEDMMSKLIQDLPSEPVEYLIHLLQKKLAPDKKWNTKDAELKSQSMKMTSHSQWPESKSSAKKADRLSASLEIDGRLDANRHYSKPWQTNSRKEKSPTKDKSRQGLSATSPAALMESNKTKRYGNLEIDGRKHDDADEIDLRASHPMPKVYGKLRESVNSEENEFRIQDATEDVKKENRHKKSLNVKESKRLRRKQLKESLEKEKNKENRHLIDDDVSNDDDDDAIELYENVNELHEEGVENPPKTGVYASGNFPHQKEQIELVLNMSKFFDSLGGAVSVASYNNKAESDMTIDNEDFESASQVTGPRRPVWEIPDSEVDTVTSQAHPMTSRRFDASMFGVKTPSDQRSQSKVPSVKGRDSITSKSAEKAKKKTSSQVSNASRRSLEVTKSPASNISGDSTRRKNVSRDSAILKAKQELGERPKTAQ